MTPRNKYARNMMVDYLSLLTQDSTSLRLIRDRPHDLLEAKNASKNRTLT